MSRTKIILIIASLAVVCIAAGAFFLLTQGKKQAEHITLPSDIAAQLKFPVYLPTTLPGTYRIKETSFTFDEGVLIFKAEATSGETIAFTEQPKPADFDFANFYSEQFTDAKTLDNVPFASVTGKNQQNYNVLSVVADNTWVLISTRAPLSQSDMQNIAAAIKPQSN